MARRSFAERTGRWTTEHLAIRNNRPRRRVNERPRRINAPPRRKGGLGGIVAQLFHPYADTAVRILLFGLAASPALLIGAGFAITRSPYVTGQEIVPTQPVPFSHEHHVGFDGLDCRYCHFESRTLGRAFRQPKSA